MNRPLNPTAYHTEAHESLGYLLVLLVGALLFGVYLKLDIATDPAGWSWIVEQAYRGARAPGGAAHPLLFAVNHLISLLGQRWPDVPAADFMMFCHRGVAALGVVFLGWYLVQRFKSVLVAFTGMLLVGFSAVYWQGALTLSPYQLGLTLFLGALCCVGRPAYGRSITRVRDWVAIILCTAALMASQNLLILVPAFLCAASDQARQRGQFIFWLGTFYLLSQGLFLYQYVIGPSELFAASATSGKIEEWLRFQSPEEGRLVLPLDGMPVTVPMEAAAEKISAILEAASHSILAFGGDSFVAYGLWFLIGLLGAVMVAVHSARRDAMVGLLIVVPVLGVSYLHSFIVAARFLPLSVGVAVICCSLVGFMVQEIEGKFRLIAAAAFLGVAVPSIAVVNYAHLTRTLAATAVQAAQPAVTELEQKVPSTSEGL